jgi:hypothetical protein
MADQIEKDDEKFNRMIVKQHPTADSFFRAERAAEGQDPIEKDDEKLDDMLMLQSLSESEEPVYSSLEEKYEEQLIMDQVSEIVGRQLSKMNEESDTLRP